MNLKRSLLMVVLLFPWLAFSQLNFIKRLQKGQFQHIVVYGTSLSSSNLGHAWMSTVVAGLEDRYGDSLVTYSIAGQGGKWSTWGVQHLEERVIAKQPDAVIIEFGINDAFSEYRTSVALAKLNLEYMIDRIRLYNESCDVILQVMNMPVGKSAERRPDLSAYYNMYRETAKEKKVMLIDHYRNWSAILQKGEEVFREYVPDGIHPDIGAAREIIAPHILRALR